MWQKREKKEFIQEQREQGGVSAINEIGSIKDLVGGEYSFAPVDTSNWQVYQDKEPGFEVRLPKRFEKTNQGFTPKNPIIGNPEDMENNVWFLIEKNDRLKQKNLSAISQEDLFNPLWSSFVASGNVDVSVKRVIVNDIPMIVVKSIFGSEPLGNKFGGWIEGAYEEESFFECGSGICSVRISSHQYSHEKQVLFYAILATLRLTE